MIVRMKKLTLLCTRSSCEETLNCLRDLEVVHLQSIQPPCGNDLDEARRLLDHLQRTLEILPAHSHVAASDNMPRETVDAVWALVHQKQALDEQLNGLNVEMGRYKPFGHFSPETARDLTEHGIHVRLYKVSLKERPTIPDGAKLIELNRDKTCLYMALISQGNGTIKAEEVPLPTQSLKGMIRQRTTLQSKLEQIDTALHRYVGDRIAVAALTDEIKDQVQYLEARNGMGETDEISYLSGFFPAEREQAICDVARQQGWGVLIEQPSKKDSVPTLLRNPKWVKTIKPLLNMINLTPGYREIDISSMFLIFFCIFYGMLVGDAGYGLLFFATTTFCRLKFKKTSRALFNLLTITSVATIVWGALTGVWFGVANPPKILETLHLTWLDNRYHIMGLCFFLGATHLTLAHGWRAIIERKRLKIFSEIGWIGSTWAMFYIASDMICGWPMPTFTIPLLMTSILLIILFMTPVKEMKANWIRHAMLPLNVINNFVDVVSYLRLFAVGLATLEVAKAFNGMASGVGWILALLILFVGHTMNIAMALMGVMVHGLRLNALEFSNHIGLEWIGQKYNPFSKIQKKGEER